MHLLRLLRVVTRSGWGALPGVPGLPGCPLEGWFLESGVTANTLGLEPRGPRRGEIP